MTAVRNTQEADNPPRHWHEQQLRLAFHFVPRGFRLQCSLEPILGSSRADGESLSQASSVPDRAVKLTACCR